jgi:hypothetical protein
MCVSCITRATFYAHLIPEAARNASQDCTAYSSSNNYRPDILVGLCKMVSALSVSDCHTLKLKLKFIYYRQSVGQSVLVSGAHLGPATNFSFSLKFPSDSCGFVVF